MPLESSIIRSIKDKAKSIPGVKVKKLWSSAANRDIDIIVVTHGLTGVYEIKQPGEVPTEWQRNKMKQWRQAGADVSWFDTADACIARIKELAELGARIKELGFVNEWKEAHSDVN